MSPVDAKPVWRKGGDAERELKLIAIENPWAGRGREGERWRSSLRKSWPKRTSKQQRQQTEASVSALVRSAHASLSAMDRNDFQAAMVLPSQLRAAAQLQQMQRWEALQDTQNNILHLMQEVMLKKARTVEEPAKRWDELIRG
jgi:hypothetical protein